jgi:hypothetical protein
MQNIAPKRVVTRRASQLYTVAFLLGAVGIFAMAFGLLMALVPLDKPAHPSYPVYVFARGVLIGVGLVAFILAIILAIRAATLRTDNDLAQQTANVLHPILDNQFTFIRSLNRRSIGYVDALLIGPPGVMVFRLVDAIGAYANEGANWMRRDPNGQWLPARISPTREDLADIRRVRQFLSKRGLGDVPLFGMIVFTQEPRLVSLQATQPELPITHLSNLYGSLQVGYLAAPPIDMTRIVAATRALIE